MPVIRFPPSRKEQTVGSGVHRVREGVDGREEEGIEAEGADLDGSLVVKLAWLEDSAGGSWARRHVTPNMNVKL